MRVWGRNGVCVESVPVRQARDLIVLFCAAVAWVVPRAAMRRIKHAYGRTLLQDNLKPKFVCSIGGKEETEEERRLRKEKAAAKKEAKKEKKLRDKEKKSKKGAKNAAPVPPPPDAPRKSLEPARGEVLAELEPRHSLDGGNLKLPPPGEHLFSDDLRSLVRPLLRGVQMLSLSCR